MKNVYSQFTSIVEQMKLVKDHWVKNKGYNPMAVPRIVKVTLNCGFGSELANNPKCPQMVETTLASITGQKPIITKARKAIAGFKVKKNQPVGATVTLRGRRMYAFLDRLIVVALPRVKDFRGLPRNSFDAKGNYNFGVKDSSIFPELPFDKLDKYRGFDVSITIKSSGPEESFEYLRDLGFPFRR